MAISPSLSPVEYQHVVFKFIIWVYHGRVVSVVSYGRLVAPGKEHFLRTWESYFSGDNLLRDSDMKFFTPSFPKRYEVPEDGIS